MRFGSVCSGIEAASVAWHPMGWRAAWLAEIEPFPCSLLDHHYPGVKNYGDMTALPGRIRSNEIEAPDVLCGGTPCQAFSVAGLRRSLDDARGNLSLNFCEIANAIDTIRRDRGEPECIIVWENVPGVLSTTDNAFGCFLAGLAGESEPLQPSGKKWTNAGCVFGPTRTVAWRVLDAQYFGVAQRRRRVFVVASAREGFDPAAVLFEFDGVRRDTAPRREAREVAPTIPARSLGGGGLGTDFDCDGGVVQVCPTLRAGGNSTGGDRPPGTDVDTCESLLVQPVGCDNYNGRLTGTVAATLGTQSGDGVSSGPSVIVPQPVAFPANLSGTQYASTENLAPSMGAKNPTAVAIPIQNATRGKNQNGLGIAGAGEPMYTLDQASQHAVAFAENSREEIRLEGGDGSRTGALTSGGGQMAVAVALRGREGGATAELGDEVQNCLRASSGGGDKPHVLAPAVRDISQTLTSNYGKQVDSSDTALGPNVVFPAMQVRRLTPRECERLQGFPDDYTLVPHRGKPAADGPRYKALGNSWAVPVVAWIGRRIAASIRQNP